MPSKQIQVQIETLPDGCTGHQIETMGMYWDWDPTGWTKKDA